MSIKRTNRNGIRILGMLPPKTNNNDMNLTCTKAETLADVEFCKDAILEFRKNLDPDTVVNQVFQMISNEGFELVFIPDPSSTKAAAFIGYRSLNLLRTGKIIYVDDLFTFPECRGYGYAGTLLNYVAKLAADRGTNAVHLDSGYDLHTAHRLYLNQGYF
ncbi:MAG: GNAT family N-acetyltransferase, partial [Sphingobacteriaceae bacterium]